MPPLAPYDLYVRRLCSGHRKQAAAMTNDDAMDAESQTVEIVTGTASAQVPDDLGFGGTAPSSSKGSGTNPQGALRLTNFLQRALPSIERILESNLSHTDPFHSARNGRAASADGVTADEGSRRMGCPEYLSGRKVLSATASRWDTSTFATVHGPRGKATSQGGLSKSLAGKSLICVWSADQPDAPMRTLVVEGSSGGGGGGASKGMDAGIERVAESLPTAICLGPGRCRTAIVGTAEGTLLLWDLREPEWMHKSQDAQHLGVHAGLRQPRYDRRADLGRYRIEAVG